MSLAEITRESLRDYLRLRVTPQQERFVAPNAVSIAQAHFHPQAWFRGIRAGEAPVGFAMLEDWNLDPAGAPEDWRREPYVALWRFMIDERWQALGFGAQAMRLLVARARSVPGTRAMTLSFVEAEGGPEPFYRRFGFERTGETRDGEQVMRLAF